MKYSSVVAYRIILLLVPQFETIYFRELKQIKGKRKGM